MVNSQKVFKMRLKKINLSTQIHLGTLITSLLTYIFTATSFNTNVLIQASLCGKCDRSKCQTVENCPGDVVLDHCRCCSQCAKSEGEKCGGQLFDECSRGLVCVISPKKGDPVTGNEIGSCTSLCLSFLYHLFIIMLYDVFKNNA